VDGEGNGFQSPRAIPILTREFGSEPSRAAYKKKAPLGRGSKFRGFQINNNSKRDRSLWLFRGGGVGLAHLLSVESGIEQTATLRVLSFGAGLATGGYPQG
jgi:hypothetical protein